MTCPALAAEPINEHDPPDRAITLYPAEVNEIADGDSHRLEKVYLLSKTDDPANIPTEDFDREGWHYTLLEILRQDNGEIVTKDYAETVTLESESKDMDTIMPLLTAMIDVTTEDGYSGTLTLDTASIKVEAAGYSTSSYAVSATRSYPNLSDADTALIPKTIEDSGRTLTLADVQWEEAAGFYHAVASYTGTVTGRYATGYIVTADYSGEVSKTMNDETIYTAVFSGTPLDAAGKGASDSTGMKWLLLLPMGGAAVGLAVLGKSMMKKHKAKKDWKEYTT